MLVPETRDEILPTFQWAWIPMNPPLTQPHGLSPWEKKHYHTEQTCRVSKNHTHGCSTLMWFNYWERICFNDWVEAAREWAKVAVTWKNVAIASLPLSNCVAVIVCVWLHGGAYLWHFSLYQTLEPHFSDSGLFPIRLREVVQWTSALCPSTIPRPSFHCCRTLTSVLGGRDLSVLSSFYHHSAQHCQHQECFAVDPSFYDIFYKANGLCYPF